MRIQVLAERLADLQASNTPAFTDGDYLYTVNSKYRVERGNVTFKVTLENPLSIVGFERNLTMYCEPRNGQDRFDARSYQWPADIRGLAYNDAAEQFRVKWAARQVEHAKAAAEAKVKADQEHERERLAYIARKERIESEVKAIRFTKATYDIAQFNGEDNVMVPVTGQVSGGLGIHKTWGTGRITRYHVTHIKSGLGFGIECSTLGQAKVAVARLRALGVDYGQDGKVIAANNDVAGLARVLKGDVYGEYGE
jgi:hypothetical protein